MGSDEMGSHKALTMIGLLMLLSWATSAAAAIDCNTVAALISACSTFVNYGIPDPIPGSLCCEAVVSLSNIADSTDNRRSICRCLMGLITAYNPNATAIATLPGFCGLSLGFPIDPNTDCNFAASHDLGCKRWSWSKEDIKETPNKKLVPAAVKSREIEFKLFSNGKKNK